MSGGIYIYDDEYFESKNEYHVMDSFEFENGEVLNEVKVEYMTFGTPIYDEDGQIKNAIIYCHGSHEPTRTAGRFRETSRGT